MGLTLRRGNLFPFVSSSISWCLKALNQTRQFALLIEVKLGSGRYFPREGLLVAYTTALLDSARIIQAVLACRNWLLDSACTHVAIIVARLVTVIISSYVVVT